jgi:hypothetical protein
VDHDGEHAGHRTKAERNHEYQREHDIGNGTAELHQPLDGETQPGRRRGIFRGQKIKGKREDGPRQRTDITDQDGFAEQRQPFPPAPEPLTDIGPDPGTVFQRKDTIEVTGEVSQIREERLEIYLRADRSNRQGGREYRRSHRKPDALAHHRRTVGVAQRGKLLARQQGNGDGHCTCIVIGGE